MIEENPPCGVCGKPVPEERWLLVIVGKRFCSDFCEQKYLELFDKWLKAAYEKRNYE